MKIKTLNELDLAQEGLKVLTKSLPPSKVAFLFSIWRIGRGDYTADRRKFFAGETVESFFAKARITSQCREMKN